MPFEDMDMERVTLVRRKAIEKSIRTITLGELKELGDELFPFIDHPWRQKYFDFLVENAGATYHYAVTSDHIHIIYCEERERGMWFVPGHGMGVMQAKSLAILKEIVGAHHHA
jgi:hypothetical protein